ncbi:SGNH/GDSL hydrolase family protein [Serratia entomophila]|uniref:SGNH/GDSL hydrolase family protein n=1 Tax=Serratia entomophila TaxID=42906 RepID=UPI002179FB0B|nr:SGNH/GDSL hydrolase family protein [Serratia entomophila]CAI0729425.1 Uncharacterised protein [Serratia entomophila]CAI1698628.1 Uncharacterised protein [Serratia entomophila]CAI2447536.1 Uncharacterised protein [Serratia entomophila]
MATTPTQKPIPSEDVRDFKFNIGKTDQFITSNEFFYIDRFGVKRYTAEGIRHFLAPLGNAYTQEQAAAAIAAGEIPDGAFFFIWSDDGVNIADKYQNQLGVATRVDGSIISTEGMVQLFNQSKEITYSVGEHYSRYESDIILLNPNKSPLLTMESDDGDDKVMVSNSYGEFDLAMPASVRTAIAVDKAAGRELQKDIVYVNTEREALLVDDSPDPKVYLYQNKITNKLGTAYGFEGVATNDITPYLNGYVNSLLRAKSGAIKNNTISNALTTVLVTGDSWWDKPTLPVSLETKLKAVYGNGGTGWVDFINEELMPGISVSMTGFTPLKNWQPPFNQGMFVSGKRITTTTTAGSVSVSGIEGQRIRIYYQDLNGAFRCNLNGGMYTVVTGTNTNTLKYVELTASAFSGNSITIDTTVNTSGNTVVLFGVNPQISTGKGVCVIKAGQAGAKTVDYVQVLQYLPAWAQALKPDAVLITLGTNDIIQKRPIAEYQQNLFNLIGAWKSAVPQSVGINMLFPAHANRPVSEGYPEYSLYEQAARDVCDALKVGYMNGLGLFPDYDNANSLNLWVGGTDKDHLNKNGADLFVGEFAIKNLLEI